MTNSHDPDDRVKPTIPTEEYGADEKGADYTTTGDPIDDPEHLAEENELHATVGNPLSGTDDVDDDVDRTTPGNPISSVEHDVEEDLPHATPGNNPVIPED
ncbi:hypothetical protein [Mycetocola zhujimingii]|uniref:hypothetical protein n=1 Tax=Mycetocola zhujimingii TaxID=2079792 RepID=UPI0013C51CD4|nr:hypothetical protein [Mycetocola zhujimingii]